MFCPLAGATCVGLENCAPAVYGANPVNGEVKPPDKLCPVMQFVDSVSIIIYSLQALIQTHVGSQQKQVAPHEAKTADELLRAIGADQAPLGT